MNDKQKAILKTLRYDALSEAEKITGNEYKADEATALLGFALQYEKTKKLDELLSSIGDTKLSNKLTDYLAIVQRFGFKIVYSEDFVNDSNVPEKMFVLWHEDLSVLLCFDTFTWDHKSEPNVNSGNFYYNWSPYNSINRYALTSSGSFFNEKDNESHITLFENDFSKPYYIPNYPADIKWDDTIRWEDYKKQKAPIDEQQNILFEQAINEGKRMVWVGDHDCREAIITKIKALFENGTFVKEWKSCPFSWLTNYMDHKGNVGMQSFEKYYEKTRNIIAKLPAHVQKRIGDYRK